MVVRSPSFAARHLPLEEPAVRAALEEGETRFAVIHKGVTAMQQALAVWQDARHE